MLFTIYVIACIGNAVVSVTAFFLYVRMRMAGRHALEKKWMSIHFITLALFVFFGVVVLVHLSNELNGRHQL